MLEEEVHKALKWRRVLSCHTTNAPQKVGPLYGTNLRDTTRYELTGAGNHAVLSWPHTFRTGDQMPFQLWGPARPTEEQALQAACQEAMLELLMRDPDMVILNQSTWFNGAASIQRIRETAHWARANV